MFFMLHVTKIYNDLIRKISIITDSASLVAFRGSVLSPLLKFTFYFSLNVNFVCLEALTLQIFTNFMQVKHTEYILKTM